MIQPGKYTGKALTGTLCEGKKYPYVAVTIGTHGNNEQLFWNGSLSEEPFANPKNGLNCPADITIRDLITMGWDGKDYENFNGLGSKEAEFVVVHEAYEGKTQVRIKFINVPGYHGNAKPVEASKVKSLQASLKGRVLAAQKAAASAPKPAGSPAPVEDDSFEFGANASNNI